MGWVEKSAEKGSNLPKICMDLKELEQYGKNFGKVPKLFFKFLKLGGYDKLKLLLQLGE